MLELFDDAVPMPVAERPDLAGFLLTWSNPTHPDVFEQAMEFWSEDAPAFGPAPSPGRVMPGQPPSYPRQ